MNDTEHLVSRTFPDRRVSAERRVDFDPTNPNRRTSDRREQVSVTVDAHGRKTVKVGDEIVARPVERASRFDPEPRPFRCEATDSALMALGLA